MALEHRRNSFEEAIKRLLGVDDFQDDRTLDLERERVVAEQWALAKVPGFAREDGCASEVQLAGLEDKRLIKRLPMPLHEVAEVDSEQYLLSLESHSIPPR
jgi:hypothetical protein